MSMTASSATATAAAPAEDVLVIDDDTATVDAYARSLRRAGLGCLTAVDGWQALEMLSGGLRPKVIVSDLRMPELGGIEFAQQLHKMSAYRARLIFVSGNVGLEDALEALRLGACEMLCKPIDADALVRAVKTALYARNDNVAPDAAGRPAAVAPASPPPQQQPVAPAAPANPISPAGWRSPSCAACAACAPVSCRRTCSPIPAGTCCSTCTTRSWPRRRSA